MTDILRLVTNETLPNGLTTNDIDILRSRVANTFQEAQKSTATHRKLTVTLKKLQETAGKAQIEKVFNALFVKLLLRVLPVKKGEVSATRVMKFCEAYFDAISSPSSTADESQPPASTVYTRFIDYIVEFLIQGTEAKDKNVRCRVCQLLASALSKVGELDDDLYSLVKERLVRRAYDKEQSVRLQAIIALIAIYDLDDPEDKSPKSINNVLTWAIRYDTCAEVRRAALVNLSLNPQNLALFVERVRDVNSVNRRCVYTHVLNETVDFRSLSIGMRESVLLHGLQDRDDTVKTAATRLLLNKWLAVCNNDLVSLLERLDVLNSKVAELTLKSFFKERSDSVELIQINDEFWNNLTPESAFMVRVFYEHCLKEKKQDIIDAQMPELTKLAFMIEFYFAKLQEKSNTEIEFILQQLLRMAALYDFGDEIGRRKTLGLMRDVLSNQNISEDLTKRCVEVVKKISINERDFALTCLEIISDLTEVNEKEPELEPETPKPARRRSKRIRAEMDEEDDMDSFHSATSNPGGAEDSSLESQALHYYKSLVIAQGVLELAEQPLEDNVQLKNMIDGIVLQAVHHPGGPVKEKALSCLALACLLSRDFAAKYVADFVATAFQSDDYKKLMIQAISDILAVFGTSVLPSEVDLNKLHSLYISCVEEEDDADLQSVTAEALCKLLLADVFNTSNILQPLLKEYYKSSDDNSRLRQILSFCLPVYCYCSLENQGRLASILVPSMKDLADEYDADEEMISPTQAIQQLIDWTDPRKVVGKDQEYAATSTVHVELARNILMRLKLTYSKDERKALCGVLNKLYFPTVVEEADLLELRQLISAIFDKKIISEVILKNQINRFDQTLQKLLESCKPSEPPLTEAEALDANASLESSATILSHSSARSHESTARSVFAA